MLSDAAEARGLRPVRPCRRRPEHGRLPRRPGRGRLRRLRRGLRRHLRRHLRRRAAARGAARRPAGLPRQRPVATRWRSRSRRRRDGKDTQIRIPTWDDCETCKGTRRQARHQAEDLHHLQRLGRGADAPGLLQRSSRPARTATAPARSFPSPAPPATARAGSRSKRRWRSRSRPASTTACASARAGNGEPGTNGGPPGDLYIEIRHQAARDLRARRRRPALRGAGQHHHARRSAARSRCRRSAARPRSTLPEGTQHGKTFRLRGKGIKGVRSSYPGDLYCHIAVETPVKLTEHQRKLLKELDESLKQGRRAPLAERQELDRPGQGPVQVGGDLRMWTE